MEWAAGGGGGGHGLLCCKVCFLARAWPPSLQNVEESLRHVDAAFFLGKVGFLVTGGKCALARQGQCAVHPLLAPG